MRIEYQQAAQFLREEDDFLILTHRRPDGDTIGSAVALCRGLRAMGKQAEILANPQVTPRYERYLDGLESRRMASYPTVISVDLATEDLLLFTGLEYAGEIALAIDHHESNTDYAELSLVRPECAACGEIVYALLQELGVALDVPMAEAIYVAVSTDTGCFKYANTTANTLRVAADMKELGVDAYPINKRLFATKTLSRLKLEAYLADRLELLAGGLVGVCTLPQSVLEELGANEDDVDDLSGFARNVEGVEIAVMIREVERGNGKISLRTGERFNASAICQRLGGGGHRAAAGATVEGGIPAAREQILRSIEAEGLRL